MKTTELSKTILKERILQEGETPEEMVGRVVDAVMGNAEEGGKISQLMKELKFLPNSPCLMNAGTDIGQLCACFVLPIEDSMEGIFTTLKDAAMVQKSGGGTGFSFNRLRPKGALVNSTGGEASGPVSFLKVFNAATNEIEQGGRRRGASLAVLNVDHPDIYEFITCKRDTGQITNFNLSVGVTDDFMEKVGEGDKKALALWDEITRNAWETGEPGLLFLDTINQDNPTPELGRLESTNPCGEVPLLPYEACVLGSIDLAKFVEHGRLDSEQLAEAARLAVIFLDRVIDVSTYPLQKIEEMVKGNRKIGLGVMGWANTLFKMGIPYDSEEAIKRAREIMNHISVAARLASIGLTEESGPFINFDRSIYKDSQARKNASLTSIAPTGTIADIAGTSYGIEPEYALVHTRRALDGKEFMVVNPVFEKELRDRGLYSTLLIEKIKANRGSIQNMPELPEDMRRVFKVAHDIAPEDHVRMQAAFQKYVEQSISKTINLPETATQEEVSEVYQMAWELGCKGVTVYRDNSRPLQVLSAKYTPTERPAVLEGKTHKFSTGCGSLYVTVNRDLAGEVHEVFAAHSKNTGCVSALLNALARVTSIALRSGVAPEVIIKTMLGQDCGQCEGISSCADAVGQALQGGNQVEPTVCRLGGACETCG